MKRLNWIVTKDDVRPAKPDGTCFYCGMPIGEEHKKGCVLRQRTVIVDFVFRVIRKVPEDWTSEMIDFHLNGSTWCLSNVADELQVIVDGMDKEGSCLCGVANGSYVREATLEDQNLYQVFIEDGVNE